MRMPSLKMSSLKQELKVNEEKWLVVTGFGQIVHFIVSSLAQQR